MELLQRRTVENSKIKMIFFSLTKTRIQTSFGTCSVYRATGDDVNANVKVCANVAGCVQDTDSRYPQLVPLLHVHRTRTHDHPAVPAY